MKTREIHPRNLRIGDRVVVSYGIVRVASIRVTTDHYTFRTDAGVEIKRAIGNWPEIPQGDLEAALREVEELETDLQARPPKAAFMGAPPVRVERLLEAERRVEQLLNDSAGHLPNKAVWPANT